MIPHYKLGETIKVRKTIYLHLVDATDGITAKTGQTGNAQISKNGAAPSTSVNAIVEVDSTNMPGLYSLELDPTELNAYGFIVVRFKNSNVAEFQEVGQVVADDPYSAHTGPGLSLPSGKGGKAVSERMHKEDMIELAKMVWNVKLRQEETAKTVLLAKSEFDPAKDPVIVPDAPDSSAAVLEAIKGLDMAEKLEDQHEAVLEAIERKEIKDYTGMIAKLSTEVSTVGTKLNALLAKESDTAEMRTIAGQLTPKLEKTQAELNNAATLVSELNDQFDSLTTKVNDLSDQLAEEIDIEKRMERVGSKVQDKAVLDMVSKFDALKAEVTKTSKKLQVAILDTRIDINKLKKR